ncbi:uncharacterized protein LOC130764062 [Actinidia eriantha]|uniref:Transmembrane protein n=1 Tax=Actinidia rufa TaxID=165716 RepID=A0A7J0GV99_9ERIC|nr:uncharacterized protein LOC130764062 [Actinidia eriantha]GFZ14775.1 hypothetical protein Acr_24g0009650 [Actinidia rufa]
MGRRLRTPFFLVLLLLFALEDFTFCAYSPAPAPHWPRKPSTPAPGADERPPPPLGPKGSKGMSGGQKAGIAIGVLAAAGVVGLGGMVYKKRRANIRRARFGSAARRTSL